MMKKITGIFSIIILALVLTACGSSEETRTFEFKDESSSMIVTYKSKDDKVLEQNIEFVTAYTNFGLNSKEEAEEFFDNVTKDYEDVEGITEELNFTDTEVNTNLTIDFEKVDLEEVKDLPGMNSDEDSVKGISMEGAAKQLTDEGFTEIE